MTGYKFGAFLLHRIGAPHYNTAFQYLLIYEVANQHSFEGFATDINA